MYYGRWTYGKALEENLGGNFEREPCHWIENGVELALDKALAIFQPFQHLFLSLYLARDLLDARTQLFDGHPVSSTQGQRSQKPA